MYSNEQGFRLDQPTHPGVFLHLEILAPFSLSVTKAAALLGVTRPTLSALLNGRSSLSIEMAIRFEKVFGIAMATLLKMQLAFDMAAAQSRYDQINLAPYVPESGSSANND